MRQVKDKWMNLKKKYKEVKLHNDRTGNDPLNWIHYDLIDSVLGKKPEENPVSTASSRSGKSVTGRQNLTSQEMQQDQGNKAPSDNACSSKKPVACNNDSENNTTVLEESEGVTSVSDLNGERNDEQREKSDIRVFGRKVKKRKNEPEWIQNVMTKFKQ